MRKEVEVKIEVKEVEVKVEVVEVKIDHILILP